MSNPKNVIRFYIGFLIFYFAFLFQMVCLCGTTRKQTAVCNATCAEFGAKGQVQTKAFVFFQNKDAVCSCTIYEVQKIARDGTVIR